MAARHRKKHHKGMGGKIDGAEVDSGEEEVLKEAEGKRRNKGGRTVKAVAHRMTGGATKMRLDRPGRKRGGRVGADTSPLSSAHGTHGADKEPKSMVGPASEGD